MLFIISINNVTPRVKDTKTFNYKNTINVSDKLTKYEQLLAHSTMVSIKNLDRFILEPLNYLHVGPTSFSYLTFLRISDIFLLMEHLQSNLKLTPKGVKLTTVCQFR